MLCPFGDAANLVRDERTGCTLPLIVPFSLHSYESVKVTQKLHYFFVVRWGARFEIFATLALLTMGLRCKI